MNSNVLSMGQKLLSVLGRPKVLLSLIFLFSFFVFSRGLAVHGLEYRDDEIFYYKSTQEMLQNHNILSPTYFEENRFQKPILFYWLMLLSYKIVGVSWVGARLVSVLFASLTVCVAWLIGCHLMNKKVAGMGALILMTVPLFFRHAKNAVPDMTLTFFIVWSVFLSMKYIQVLQQSFPGDHGPGHHQRYSTLFFVSCALGFMVKGLAAVVIPFLILILYVLTSSSSKIPLKQKMQILKNMEWGKGFLLMILIILPWFLYMFLTHGQEYLRYMFVNETKERLLGQGQINLIDKIGVLWGHFLFYLQVIGSYFAPWSLFFFLALLAFPFRKNDDRAVPFFLRWMFVWIGVVLVIFIPMYFVINHYMLGLAVPFALLVGYFLLEPFPGDTWIKKGIRGLRTFSLFFIFTSGFFAYIFLFVFLAHASKIWVPILILVYVPLGYHIIKGRSQVQRAYILVLFMIFVFSQSQLLAKAGLTSHSTLQKFAQVIKNEGDDGFVVGVGSHDIHEKEFQVYFDNQLKKVGVSQEEETMRNISHFLDTNKKVYCLLTEADYQKYLKFDPSRRLEISKEDYMFRRRIHPDKDFFVGLLTLDQEKVYDYLMEKIILIRKDNDA